MIRPILYIFCLLPILSAVHTQTTRPKVATNYGVVSIDQKVIRLSTLNYQEAGRSVTTLILDNILIEDPDYSGLYRLRYLNDLEFNQVSQAPRITKTFFNNLKNLHTFIIRAEDDSAAVEFEEDAFDYAAALQNLQIEKLPFFYRLTNRLFQGLTNLLDLKLEGGYVEAIDDNAFDNLRHLQILSLANNRISHIKPGTFKNLKYLVSLNLNGNKLNDFSWDAFSGLYNVRHFSLYNIPVEELRKTNEIKKVLPRTGEIEIGVRDCNSAIGLPKSYSGFTITYTDLINKPCPDRFTPYTTTPAPIDHDTNTTDDESSYTINLDTTIPLTNKKINLLTDLPLEEQFRTAGAISHLSFKNIAVQDENLSNFCRDVPDLRSLKFLEFNKAESLPIFSMHFFDGCSNLQVFITRGSSVSLHESVFGRARLLRQVELENVDNVYHITKVFTFGLKNLVFFSMENGNLRIIDTNAFDELGQLEYLSFYNNKITHLDPGVFKNLINLKSLNLGRNPIQNFAWNILYGVNNLDVLYIHKQDLRVLNDNRKFAVSRFLKTIYVDIPNCSDRDFVRGVKQIRGVVLDRNRRLC